MEHSVNFELIKSYYDNNLYSNGRVWNVGGKATDITEAEYQEITGLAYFIKI
ncbi:XkdX family protein [Clostridium uliginosum]|uniref:Phage uncharacterized protein (Phage_XkdX) n=1 Tax=Clostridium uliginosum TaxID=119641 RepID=A0A1I1QX07_9CLOT|nr:XkdX family protein [Clostridium uliginosum]SFD26522.1 Phage uncharacterised protein (Phage_XkdX) [Clostridium uliginosum]